MHIIYQCYGSAHSSVIAAAIHLGRLPLHRIPSLEEVMALPDFDRSVDQYLGTLFYKGRDERGFSVYTLGLGREWRAGRRTIESILERVVEDTDPFKIVHALNCITVTTKIGGALSRRYGIRGIGRPLAAWGVQRSYPRLVALVRRVKEELAESYQ